MTNPRYRVLATIQTYSASAKKWRAKRIIAINDGRSRIVIPLSRGGVLCLYPKMVRRREAKSITRHILGQPGIFREYRVQGFNKEPRLQAHFHHDATADFDQDPQPGYRYNNQTTLKAQPLSIIPSLENLANHAKQICQGEGGQWDIGATVVLYRDGNDKMGQHTGTKRLPVLW